jgi:hypothetical protein
LSEINSAWRCRRRDGQTNGDPKKVNSFLKKISEQPFRGRFRIRPVKPEERHSIGIRERQQILSRA